MVLSKLCTDIGRTCQHKQQFWLINTIVLNMSPCIQTCISNTCKQTSLNREALGVPLKQLKTYILVWFSHIFISFRFGYVLTPGCWDIPLMIFWKIAPAPPLVLKKGLIPPVLIGLRRACIGNGLLQHHGGHDPMEQNRSVWNSCSFSCLQIFHSTCNLFLNISRISKNAWLWPQRGWEYKF